MARYWVSWACPITDYRPIFKPKRGGTLMENDKRVLGWWCSGYNSEDNAILCALLEAKSERQAKKAIHSHWPESRGSKWWCLRRVADDYTPGPRFPMFRKDASNAPTS